MGELKSHSFFREIGLGGGAPSVNLCWINHGYCCTDKLTEMQLKGDNGRGAVY